ncbi:MAG: restriction endonuclease [Ruminococcus sp.]|nr:restriction endonuclease [Ruminococcus sp.]
MDLYFDKELSDKYKSNSQKIRVISENWLIKNMYCPCCGNPHLTNLANNKPVADMICDCCGEVFELKSKNGRYTTKINDGAYYTMIDRITSDTNPELLLLEYSNDYRVNNLTLVPKFFFTPDIIEKRKPLADTAKRAGWIGCNILYSEIPSQGKIPIIKECNICDLKTVINKYKQIKKLQMKNIESRGWMIDVLNCINNINNDEFSLTDVYRFVDELQRKHINNHNVEAKIRQQLQFLRDKGFIEFLERGHYKKKI